MSRSRYFTVMLCLMLIATACSSPATTTPVAPAQPTVAPAATQTPATATAAPTNTPAPSSTPEATAALAASEGRACLVGAAWELTDMSDYFSSVMAQAGNGAEFAGQSGTITYIFGNDGVASVEADNFQMTLKVDTQGVVLDIAVSINGRAAADFTLTEPDKITFSNPQMGDLKFSAMLNGTELFSGTPDEMAAMFGVSPDPQYNTFTYTCSGTTMTYTPPVPNAQPLTFKRVP